MRRLIIFIFLIFCSKFSFSLEKKDTITPKAQYVWIDKFGEGRQVYAYFRNEFELKDIPEKATIQVYAFSNYSLWVNGKFVNYGPIRSYQQHPYFDSVDISSCLKKGKNVIAVKVLSFGMQTFQLPFGTAGFIAWGNIKSNSNDISFNTPGNWVCRKAEGYNKFSPRFSFAQGPIENFDARLEPDEWQSDHILPKKWQTPILLNNQQYFGTLSARTIPLLTNTEVDSKSVVSRLNLSTKDQIYNWNTQTDDRTSSTGQGFGVLNYTYLFSPVDQDLTLGFSWGKFWLNGLRIKTVNQPEKAFRSNAKVHLNKGWNQLFAREEIIWNNLDGMLAIPSDAGIQLSVNKKLNNPMKIALSGPLTKSEMKITGDDNSCPDKPELLPIKWNYLSGNEPFVNPAKEIAWLDVEKVYVNRDQISNIVIPANKNQALIFDLGGIQLGRIFIDVNAPTGTTFDLTWSEDLKDSSVTLFKRLEVNAVSRFISHSGKQHFETFRPFGLRYLQVTVRNHSQPVTLLKAGVYKQIYPFQKKGSFECSDTLMNAIWEMGWRTIQMCSEDSYIDTPFRERGHYAGDFFPEFATTLATSGDPRLAKQTVRLFNDVYANKYKNFEPVSNEEFPLINFIVASWYIRQFSDKKFAEELYPIFSYYFNEWHNRRCVDGFYHQKNVFIEWTNIDKNSDLTSFQALMYASFDQMSTLCNMLGKKIEADKFKGFSEEIKQFIQTKCWDIKSGNFIDGMKDGTVLSSRYPGSSAFPSIWKIPTPDQEKSIQNWFKESLINIGPSINRQQTSTPYGGFYALASLYQQENVAVAEQFIRKNWGKMVLEVNDLTWEDFNRDNQATMSHAWSSSPTYFLSTQALGVDLGFPGSLSPDTIYIRPQSEILTWAKGTVPHPKGMVTVDWKINGNKLLLNYSAPKGVSVIVKPRGRLAGFNLQINQK